MSKQTNNICVSPEERLDIIQDLQMSLGRLEGAGVDQKQYLSQKSRISYLYKAPAERVRLLSQEIKKRIEDLIIEKLFIN